MKKLHPDYERYLENQVHLKDSTLSERRGKLNNWPSPDNLTVAWWKQRIKQIAPKTAQTERAIMFHVLRFLEREDQIKEMKTITLPRIEDSVTVEDLYTTSELESIFAATMNPRDRAMLQVLYESACRAGELLSMDFKNVQFDNDGTAMIIVRGKTGTREIPINFSVPALREWMNKHPVGKGPIWIRLRSPYRQIIEDTLYKNVKATLGRANIHGKKKIVHMFRHTGITEFVRRGILGQSLHKLVGWTKKSSMESVYVHLSTEDVVNEVRAKVFGFETEENRYEPVIKSKKCPKCEAVNEPSARFCHECNMPISEDAIVRAVDMKSQQAMRITELEEQVKSLELKIERGVPSDEATLQAIADRVGILLSARKRKDQE